MRLCPWADVVYGCDGPWWLSKNGLPEFTGTKLAHDTGVCAKYQDVHKIEIEKVDRILVEEPGIIGNGGNSGYQSLNIGAQFGAMRIMLIGFDMHGADGVHWYGANRWKSANNPRDTNFTKWRDHLNNAAKSLGLLGIEVINASLDSALVAFPKMSVEHTLARWGL